MQESFRSHCMENRATMSSIQAYWRLKFRSLTCFIFLHASLKKLYFRHLQLVELRFLWPPSSRPSLLSLSPLPPELPSSLLVSSVKVQWWWRFQPSWWCKWSKISWKSGPGWGWCLWWERTVWRILNRHQQEHSQQRAITITRSFSRSN